MLAYTVKRILTYNSHILLRFVVLGFHVLDLSDDTLPVQDLTENNVFTIQMRSGNSRDKELGAVGTFEVAGQSLESYSSAEELELPGPALAIDNRNGLSCFFSKFSSSNFSP